MKTEANAQWDRNVAYYSGEHWRSFVDIMEKDHPAMIIDWNALTLQQRKAIVEDRMADLPDIREDGTIDTEPED